MPYSQSGSNPAIITATGTENGRDISGAAVSNFLGAGNSDNTDLFGRIINNARVVPSGTINLDGKRCLWAFRGTSDPGNGHGLITIPNGGTLNVDCTRTRNVGGVDYVDYLERVWLLTQAERTEGGNRWAIEIESGGTLNWSGGEANVRFRSIIRDGGTFVARNIAMDAGYDPALDLAHQPQWRMDSSLIDIDGFKLRRGWITWIEIPAQFSGYAPTQCAGALKFSSGLPDADFIITAYQHSDSNYGVELGSVQSFGFWSGSRPVFQDPFEGSLLRAGKNEASSNNNYGLARVYQRVRPFITDLAGSGINDARIGFRDSNGGITTVYNDEGFAVNPWDNGATILYSEALTNGLVASELMNILTAAIAVDTSMPGRFNTPDDTGDFANWSRRGIHPPVPGPGVEPDDVFRFYVAAYHEISNFFDIPLKGKNGRNPAAGDTVIALDRQLLVDPFITEQDASLVAAYTSFTNLDQIYDWLKLQKTLTDELFEYLGFDTQFAVESSGLLGTASGLNVIVDANAAIGLNTSNNTFTTNAIVAGAKFAGFSLAPNQSIQFGAPNDVMAAGRLRGTSQVLLASNGAYDFAAWTFDSGEQILLTNGATSAIALVSASQVANVTAGPGVTIQSPMAVFSVTGLPIGAEVRIYNLNTPLPDFGDELAGVENVASTTFLYSHSKNQDDVLVQVFADGFKEFTQRVTLMNSDQSFNPQLVVEDSI